MQKLTSDEKLLCTYVAPTFLSVWLMSKVYLTRISCVFILFFCKEKKYSAHRIHNYKIPSLCCMDLKVHGEWCREFVYLH